MAWLDNDGLYRKYGTEKTVPNKAGEFCYPGGTRLIEIKGLDLTTLTTTPRIIADTTFFPAGMKVESVEVVTTTAATTGTTAALNIGLMETDRTTVVDADGIAQAIAAGDMSDAGEKVVKNGPAGASNVGAFAGTAPTESGYITASTSTGTFTAGVVTIRIHLRRD